MRARCPRPGWRGSSARCPAVLRLAGEVGLQFRQLGAKSAAGSPSALRRRARAVSPVGAGGAADSEVDPSGVQRLEGAELLRHGQRRMVRQHHPARADPDRGRGGGDLADQDRRGRAGDARQVVVLRDPVTGEAEPLGVPGQVDAAAKRLADRFAGRHRAQVEHRQGNGEAGGHKQKTVSTGRPRQLGRGGRSRAQTIQLERTGLTLPPRTRGARRRRRLTGWPIRSLRALSPTKSGRCMRCCNISASRWCGRSLILTRRRRDDRWWAAAPRCCG